MIKGIVANEKNSSEELEKYHIHELDGIRAIAIIIIVGYHFWQQSWIAPRIGMLSFDWLIRNGAILVDLMIFLSAFCLFLPYARHMIYGEKEVSTKEFYIHRFARIAPSYYLCIILVFVLFAIPNREYSSSWFMMKDLSTHLLFIQNWFADTLLYTKLNGVLWTVAVEVQYYLLFPFIAKSFVKRPKSTYAFLMLFGMASCIAISNHFEDLLQPFYTNHAFTFAVVYANGILGAYLYMLITKKLKRTKTMSIVCTFIAIGCVYIFKLLCHSRQAYVSEIRWQIDYRLLLSFVFMIFVISSIMASKIYRVLLNNRLMKFIAGISFNLYIYHQFISVKLKEFHIPFWSGDVAPNVTGDKIWQWQYLLLCIGLSLLVACIMTYGVERPVSKIIKGKNNKGNDNKFDKSHIIT